jgi:hypothetical protein
MAGSPLEAALQPSCQRISCHTVGQSGLERQFLAVSHVKRCGRTSFWKKSSKKLLIILVSACPDRPKPSFAKVFWFFFQKSTAF